MADEVNARLSKLEDELGKLKEDVKVKDRQIRYLQDIEAIKQLQCAYGYYLERWMNQEIIDCFSNSPEVSGTFVEGTYKGPEGIRRYFSRSEQPPEFLHQVMQFHRSSRFQRTGTGHSDGGTGTARLPSGRSITQSTRPS
jgi:hypothetical protein